MEGRIANHSRTSIARHGMGRPEPLYEHYYLPPNLNETGAIELNDYLMLGAALGIPVLFCFGMYVWLSLTKKAESGKHRQATQGKSKFRIWSG